MTLFRASLYISETYNNVRKKILVSRIMGAMCLPGEMLLVTRGQVRVAPCKKSLRKPW